MTFYELERRCKQRRIKKIIFAVLLIVLIVLVFIVWKLIYNSHHLKKISVSNNTPKKTIILTPIIPDISLPEDKIPPKKINKPKKIIKPIKKPTPPKQTKNLNKPQPKSSSILQVESLPPYNNCIQLANKYLNEKKYNLALKWAKNANIQNKTLPDSWIVSAKALFYSGKKERAIEILRIYLKYNKNKKVEKLLKEFENEKNN